MRLSALVFALTIGCQTPAPRAVVEIYMHPNGLSNCVVTEGSKWVADASCCPTGFTAAGFSAPSATAFEAHDTEGEGEDAKEVNKINRRIYRHVVCLQDAPTP